MSLLPIALVCSVVSFAVSSAWAQDRGEPGDTAIAEKDTLSASAEDVLPFVVTIRRVTVGDMRIADTLAITLKSFGRRLAAFELKIGVESPFIDIDTIVPGEFYDSCNWQFFNSRSLNIRHKDGYPPVLWQAVAIAQVTPGKEGPICYGLDGEASLVKLVVTSEHISRVPDTVAPIFFFWEDCSDNTISGVSGDTLAISAKVFDFYNTEYKKDIVLFPNRTGASDECIDPRKPNRPHRLIEFHNGGVEFRLDVGKNPADTSQTDTVEK